MVCSNKLTLNISKTNYMLFGKRKFSRNVIIHIRNVNIERVRVVKFLGVYVDDITYVKSKLSKSVGIMYRCSHLLNRSSIAYNILFTVLAIFNILRKNMG